MEETRKTRNSSQLLRLPA
uniref:Uncharacterized protein n=1 Tax=Rhizophora mucronata TaxID=61149 RepID=A0A2P2QHQ4_RHIMU